MRSRFRLWNGVSLANRGDLAFLRHVGKVSVKKNRQFRHFLGVEDDGHKSEVLDGQSRGLGLIFRFNIGGGCLYLGFGRGIDFRRTIRKRPLVGDLKRIARFVFNLGGLEKVLRLCGADRDPLSDALSIKSSASDLRTAFLNRTEVGLPLMDWI